MNTWTFESALDWIKGNFRWPGGFIKPRVGYVPTDMDREAIQWLVDNEQFAFEEVAA
ncbi:hypothetical protein SAMN05443245_5177 [Paraburkholderia fungorum]|uniref:Uncharacterized protein n=1 Tax=Paraburkholderia fungorum TaxID=134537 RepID=A0A1H1IH66_9BURK|nr:hypothetical protein [Paraburkholderia fungorum]SDR37041.1 hypothetical protein SAMN05443245_5177 [Paraburkholderia fungorum]